MFQYFITIVPTKLNTYRVSAETHQYSVTEQVGLNVCMGLYICVVCYGSVRWMCLDSSCCPAGPSDKPCCGQPWSLRDLYEIRYQLTHGQSQRAAHASLAVPYQTLWHHWRHFLHHRYLNSFSETFETGNMFHSDASVKGSCFTLTFRASCNNIFRWLFWFLGLY